MRPPPSPRTEEQRPLLPQTAAANPEEDLTDIVNSIRLAKKLGLDVLPLIGRALAVMLRVFGATFAFSLADKSLLAAIPPIGDVDSTTMLMMGRSLMPVQNFVGVLFGENKALLKERDTLKACITALQDLKVLLSDSNERVDREDISGRLQAILNSIDFEFQLASNRVRITSNQTVGSEYHEIEDCPFAIHSKMHGSSEHVDDAADDAQRSSDLPTEDALRKITAKAREVARDKIKFIAENVKAKIAKYEGQLEAPKPGSYDRYVQASLQAKKDQLTIIDNILNPDKREEARVIPETDSLSKIDDAYNHLITQNNREIGRIFRHGLYLSVCLSAPVALMYYFAAGKILSALGQHPFVVSKSVEYFKITALTLIVVNIMTAIQRVFQGFKKLNSVLGSNALQTAVSLAGYGLMILGPFGLPKLGMTGFGYSYLMGSLTAVLVYTVYLACKSALEKFHFFNFKDGIKLPLLKQLGAVGLPIGFQFAIDGFVNLSFTLMIAARGLVEAKSLVVAAMITLLMSVVTGAIGSAVNGYAANLYGKTRFQSAVRVGQIGIAYSTILPALAAIIIGASGDAIPSLLLGSENKGLLSLTKFLALIECGKQMLSGVQLVSSMGANSLKDKTKNFAMMTSLVFACLMSIALLCAAEFGFKASVMTLYLLKFPGVAIAAALNYGHYKDVADELVARNGQVTKKSMCHATKDGLKALLPACLFPMPHEADDATAPITAPSIVTAHPL